MSRNIALGLKSVGTFCPYLQRVSPTGLRFLTSSSSTNRLSQVANQCPAMGFALANKSQFSTTTKSSQPSSSDSVKQQQARGYASIVPETSVSNGLPRSIKGRSTAIPTSTNVAGVKVVAEEKEAKVFTSGDPTNALGFAKHEVTPSTPAQNGLFDYELFYNEQLEKKHKDKSYRVSFTTLDLISFH